MLNILIAEDDLDDLFLFKEALAEVLPVYNITHARNGLQCLSFLETMQSPDVIFLDIRMPLKNGFQCLEVIKAHSSLCNIPVIMLSTSDNLDDVELSYKSGALLYLVKPTTTKFLVIALKGVFHLIRRPNMDMTTIENFVVMDKRKYK
ncbi:MAG TPA: response regulator [Segetibacter sp.]|jgi:CheY-like chemotaxis protein